MGAPGDTTVSGNGQVPGVGKIAVLRANGIGDFVFTIPALESLRAAYPGAEIVLLGQEWHERFLRGRPGPVDRVVVVPPSRGVNGGPDVLDDWPALEAFFERMRCERFDLALQLHGGGCFSNPFLKGLRARVTAGLRAPGAAALDRTIPYVYYQPEVLRYLEAVSLVGARPHSLEPRLEVTDADLAESRQVVPEERQPLVVLNPGASDPRRRWPVERFAAVGTTLARHGCRVVVAGSPAERELARGVTSRIQAQALDISGRLSLGGLLGVISRARLVVSNDSGPLHLAGAVGTATVGIYWCGNLVNAGPITRARHRPLLSWQLNCRVCGCDITEHECEHRPSFVDRVPVDEVLDAAFALLDEGGLRLQGYEGLSA